MQCCICSGFSYAAEMQLVYPLVCYKHWPSLPDELAELLRLGVSSTRPEADISTYVRCGD